MEMKTDGIDITDVTASNVTDLGIFCIKDKRSPGFRAKVEWFRAKINKGLKIKIATDSQGRQLGFIEYIPSELAWRPVKADNYLFIQCIAMFVKEAKDKGIGTLLLQQCEKDAKEGGRSGICAMSSSGPWIANKLLYEKNRFIVADLLERYELMAKSFDDKSPMPRFIDWRKQQSRYKGWTIVYSDQCPWHDKSVTDLQKSASDHGIELTVKKLNSPGEAQKAPSGFGTFALIKDGILLADHYISSTRFENILRQEIKK